MTTLDSVRTDYFIVSRLGSGSSLAATEAPDTQQRMETKLKCELPLSFGKVRHNSRIESWLGCM